MTDGEMLSFLKKERVKTIKNLNALKSRTGELENEMEICNTIVTDLKEGRNYEKKADLAYIGSFRLLSKDILTIEAMNKVLSLETVKNKQDIAYFEQVLKSIDLKIDYLVIKIRYKSPATHQMLEEIGQLNVG